MESRATSSRTAAELKRGDGAADFFAVSHLQSWLADNVRSAAEKCGALAASVYVPTPWNHAAPGMLVHAGPGDPVHELANMETAHAFQIARADARTRETDEATSLTPTVLTSETANGVLLPIPLLTELSRRALAPYNRDGLRHARRLSDHQGAPPIVGWLGLRFAEPSDPSRSPAGWQAVLELSTVLASTYVCFYGILTDPVTGLPGRAELNGALRAEVERAQTLGLPFSLLFVKVEGVAEVNERLGRRAGDAVLREFLEALHATVRRSDTVMRYGGTVFAMPLRDVPASGAVVLGEKIRRSIAERRFLNETIALHCAVGVASCEHAGHEPLQPFELLRRADQALLAARREDGKRTVMWSPEDNMPSAEQLDPLLGVFTGHTEKDYRNMRLLWEVLQALSDTSDTDLPHATVARMCSLFAVTRAGFFQTHGAALRLTIGRQRPGAHMAGTALADAEVRPEERQLNDAALAALTPQHTTFDAALFGHEPAPWTGVAVPLAIEGRGLGTLYLAGSTETLEIDSSDFPVLESVAAQLTLALDRQQLAAQQRRYEQQEQERLKVELARLRTTLTQARFVFSSQVMTDLLNTTRRVAATDATVLITGESGTGKEMLAHVLHDLSGRKNRPLVIVDCSAIPASLMDSELFGRERGAYTGAERRAPGRLAQADGGTVFLDEIGELPLEVQAKLLRFVQEKTLTMVGATRPQRVDVRIIAATNRSLEAEVRDGRFREDLFHRLNVVRLRLPPLRERPDDAALLAGHFLETFAGQYAKPLTGFDTGAQQLIRSYPWPGNVRELQNTILQAVVLAEGQVLTGTDLQLQVTQAQLDAASIDAIGAVEVPRSPHLPAAPEPRSTSFNDAWEDLRIQLSASIDEIIAAGPQSALPLGKWLGRDLVLEAYEQSARVIARAAARVGLAETTFARRLRQAEADAASTRHPDFWPRVRASLAIVVATADGASTSLADQIDDLILALVLAKVADRVPQAAGLMGLSLPTMKRRIAESQQKVATLPSA